MAENYKEAKGFINAEFEKYVPSTGKAEDLYGELIRAISKIGYRWYNDGDRIGVGYGNETCNYAARFIGTKASLEIGRYIEEKMWGLTYETDEKYEELLENLIVMMSEYLKEHKDELIGKETDSMDEYVDKDDYAYGEDEYDEDYEDEYDDEDYE